jgi:hypothetical protein
LECDEEPVFDSQFGGGFATALMKFGIGVVKDFQHGVKSCSFHAEKPFEQGIA